jgi:hypothetical protein
MPKRLVHNQFTAVRATRTGNGIAGFTGCRASKEIAPLMWIAFAGVQLLQQRRVALHAPENCRDEGRENDRCGYLQSSPSSGGSV